jgi:hypothetical protein
MFKREANKAQVTQRELLHAKPQIIFFQTVSLPGLLQVISAHRLLLLVLVVSSTV